MKSTPRINIYSIGSALALSMGIGACIAPPVEAPQTTVQQQTSVSTSQSLKDEVDLLFMVDDSGSMQPKQKALRDRFPQLIETLDGFAAMGSPANYHIGVVTSDLGSPHGTTGNGCGSSLGGKLQAVGRAAASGCQGPAGGAHYLVYNQKDHSQDNIPSGQTLEQTFTCMASVTTDIGVTPPIQGCGLESQLESVYVALHDPPAENAGFLRPNAILAVVWVTDEDDCSEAAGTDLDVASQTQYGPLASYRCTRYGITCDGQFPLPSTPVASFNTCTSATPAQGSKLTDVNKYINFFSKSTAQGGIKADPHDVILAAITAPANPFGTSADPNPAGDCGGASSCTVLNHSCIAPDNTAFFGDPAVRMHQVLAGVQNNQVTSICDTDYKNALTGIGDKIVAALKPSCLSTPIADLMNPDCTVDDATLQSDGTTTKKSIPFCDASHSVKPCYSVAQVTNCPKVCNPVDGKFQQVGIDIDRGTTNGMPNSAPAGTTAEVSCATIAIANQDPNAACGGSSTSMDGGT